MDVLKNNFNVMLLYYGRVRYSIILRQVAQLKKYITIFERKNVLTPLAD